jgi:hypothetical protein
MGSPEGTTPERTDGSAAAKRVVIVHDHLDAATTARLIADLGQDTAVELVVDGCNLDGLDGFKGPLVEIGAGIDPHVDMVLRRKSERPKVPSGQGRRNRAQRAAAVGVAEVLVETRQQRRAAERAARKQPRT